jgi:hypothetical protein
MNLKNETLVKKYLDSKKNQSSGTLKIHCPQKGGREKSRPPSFLSFCP